MISQLKDYRGKEPINRAGSEVMTEEIMKC